MSKKILVVTDNLRDQINGVVTTFTNIEEPARRDGYHIHYISPGDFAYINAPGYPEVKLSWAWKISDKIKAIDPDYIHIATEGPVGLSARVWCERNGVPYNTSYHTRFPEFLKQIYGVPECLTYWYLRWFHKNSRKVLTTTRGMVLDLESHGFKNVTSWTRGVNRDNLKTTIHGRRLNRKPTILSVGRISKEKGLADLIPLQYEYDITIVGDGPYKEELKRQIPNALFPGYKTGQELADYYATADIFVFPSTSDTFGLVMIEAMSLGTPVAAYPVRGPLDVIDPGVTGVMNENLADAIKQAMKLDRNRVKEASRIWTWDACWDIFKQNLVSAKN